MGPVAQDNGNTHEEQDDGHEAEGADEEAHGHSYQKQQHEEDFANGLEHGGSMDVVVAGTTMISLVTAVTSLVTAVTSIFLHASAASIARSA